MSRSKQRTTHIDMTNHKISAIIPAHNCEKYIIQAIDSVMNQTYGGEIEAIVIDDASADETYDAVVRYCRKSNAKAFTESEKNDCIYKINQDKTIRLIRNSSNLGVAETRNKGISIAAGDYIAFLDGDDWWSADKIEKQMHLASNCGSGGQPSLIYSARELVSNDGTPTGKNIHVPAHTSYEKLLYTNVIPCSSVLMRKEVARSFRMEHSELAEDYIYWLRILKKWGPAAGIDEPLLKSRMSEGGRSRNKLRAAAMHFGSYRVVGIPFLKAVYYFVSYAVNGVKKYS